MGLIKLPSSSINFFTKNLPGIFESGNLAEGPWNKKLSEFVKDYTSSPSALPTNSNGSGLVSLMAYYRHYHSRRNVLIQNNTMYGVKVMVAAAGCSLSGFIESELKSLMPSLKDIKNILSKLSNQDKDKMIILLSHIGGIINPDIQEIAQLCKEENIILLEDCAHSLGATLNDKHSGLYGNAGVYSLYSTKAIPAGEGGIVVSNDKQISEMIADFSIYDRFNQKLEIGNNIRISEVQALLSFAVIKECNEIIKNKTIMAKMYMEACEEKGIKYISQCEEGQSGNYYKFIIYSEKKPVKEEFLNLKTVTSPVYDYDIGVYNNVANYHACLPIWYKQSHEVVNQVINEL
jgi:perosamine synthetase